jgi:hypothetical protein
MGKTRDHLAVILHVKGPVWMMVVQQVMELLETTSNVTEVAVRVGLKRQTVLRIKENPESAFERVGRWAG